MMRRPCFSRRRIVSSLMRKPNRAEQPLTAPTTYQVSDQMRDRPRTRTSVEIALTNPE